MKTLITAIFLSIAAAILLPGCKKFLDVKPKTQIAQADLFTTQQGFFDATAGVYFTMQQKALYGEALTMSFLEVVARRYDVTGAGGSLYFNPTYADAYGTKGLDYLDQTYIAPIINNVWDSTYYAVANANNIIANMDAHKGVFSGENYNLVKGECLGLRAFLHFDLLRMFGPSYLAGKDIKCIPYVTVFDAKKVTPLSTVAAITDSVIADLNTAEKLLVNDKSNFNAVSGTDEWLNSRKSHFNYYAAEATLARVYLYRGDKPNALIHALNVINSGAITLQTAAQFRPGTTCSLNGSAEEIFGLSKYDLRGVMTYSFNGSNNTPYPLNNEPYNIDNIYEYYTTGANDVRYLNEWVQYSGLYTFLDKYDQQTGVQNTDPTQVPLIRLAEMYYIAAESSPSPAEALKYLNTIRENRALPDLGSGLDADAFQDEIRKEYTKEFYAEGQLFYYYKRLNYANIWDNDGVTLVPAIINGSQNIYVFPLPIYEQVLRKIN